MRSTLIVLTIATALLGACNKSTSAPSSSTANASSAAPSSAAPQTVAAPVNSQSGDAVSQKVRELAGGGATDCRVRTQAQDQTQKATDCAMHAAKDKHAFYVGYDMPGLSVGYAGNSQGKLYSVQAEDTGAKTEAKSVPCPAELRIAQSGRVTCMTPGSGMGTGGNPHGGMPAATGENPHGGITMPNLGGSQGTAKPAHPPKKQ